MVQPTYPGVYVAEVSSGVRSIAGASTSIPAFIGEAEKGPINEPVKVFNFTEYTNTFGGFLESGRFLTHSVFNFFNNGGSQCYVLRVGDNYATADIQLEDRGYTPDISLTITAKSPGDWGNTLIVNIEEGTNDPIYEFNLSLYENEISDANLLAAYKNLSMSERAPNFVETVTGASPYIVISINDNNTINIGNTNVVAGSSTGADAPTTAELTAPATKLNININNDGYQEINLADAVGSDTGQVADLTPPNIADAIEYLVTHLTPNDIDNQSAFSGFECTGGDEDPLVLTSGEVAFWSSVSVGSTSNSEEDAAAALRLGKVNGGAEILGSRDALPILPTTDDGYPLGVSSTPGVRSATPGSDGLPIEGAAPYNNAFPLLNPLSDVSLIAVPGVSLPGVISYGLSYCANTANRPLRDCFFIGDMPLAVTTVSEAQDFMANRITTKNSYGAIYLPWVKVPDPKGGKEPILVPPSGFAAGLYAKTDAERGVWKAPAGTAVSLAGSLGLAKNFTDVEHGQLNDYPYYINVIRQFPAAGIVLFGSRTVTSDTEWLYIPVRRMAIFLRVSIYRGIQWAVFEPNDAPLWNNIRLNIESFMMRLFRQGAFQGSSPAQAFFVKCDSETTTQADIDAGIVNVQVGFAPLKPAEFVMVTISQKAGQS